MTQSKGGRRAVAAMCCAALFLFALYLGAIGVFLPVLGNAFGLGPAVQGRVFPANFGGFIVGVLLCGFLSDRLGRKRVLMGAMGLFALALGLAGISHSFGWLLVAFALIGAGGGAMETVSSALAADLFPEKRAAILNTIQVAFGAGAVVSPLLSHRLLAAGTDWHRLFLATSVANFVLLAVLSVLPVPAQAQESEALNGAALRRIVKQPVFLMLCLCQALYVGAETGLSSWLPSYFDHLPQGAAWSGLVVSAFWVAVTVGRATVGGGVRGLPLPRLAGGLAVAGAIMAALTLLPNAPGLVLLGVLGTGLFFSGIFGLVLAESGERFPRSSGTVFGAVVAAGGVGGAGVPWAIGELAGPWGWQGAMALVPAAAALLAVLLLLLDRHDGNRAGHS